MNKEQNKTEQSRATAKQYLSDRQRLNALNEYTRY